MWRYILKRLAMMVFVVLGVAVMIFSIMYFTSGDPAVMLLGSSATPAQLEAKRAAMGLDQPYLIQLIRYLKDTFIYFDFGTSYILKVPVIDELLVRFPRTLVLATICMIISTAVGLPLGITAAVHQNRWQDRVCMVIALLGVSLPGFWLALMLVLVFAVKLQILPPYGIGGIEYYILPCVANSVANIAMQARQTRSSMLDVIRSDYIVTARAKGLEEKGVIYKHALPNALIPIITIIGNTFGKALGGTVIIETVFSIPGIGMFMTTGINNRDYPVVRGCVVLLAIAFSIIMLIVDLVYAMVDPKIRAQYTGKKRR